MDNGKRGVNEETSEEESPKRVKREESAESRKPEIHVVDHPAYVPTPRPKIAINFALRGGYNGVFVGNRRVNIHQEIIDAAVAENDSEMGRFSQQSRRTADKRQANDDSYNSSQEEQYKPKRVKESGTTWAVGTYRSYDETDSSSPSSPMSSPMTNKKCHKKRSGYLASTSRDPDEMLSNQLDQNNEGAGIDRACSQDEMLSSQLAYSQNDEVAVINRAYSQDDSLNKLSQEQKSAKRNRKRIESESSVEERAALCDGPALLSLCQNMVAMVVSSSLKQVQGKGDHTVSGEAAAKKSPPVFDPPEQNQPGSSFAGEAAGNNEQGQQDGNNPAAEEEKSAAPQPQDPVMQDGMENQIGAQPANNNPEQLHVIAGRALLAANLRRPIRARYAIPAGGRFLHVLRPLPAYEFGLGGNNFPSGPRGNRYESQGLRSGSNYPARAVPFAGIRNVNNFRAFIPRNRAYVPHFRPAGNRRVLPSGNVAMIQRILRAQGNIPSRYNRLVFLRQRTAADGPGILQLANANAAPVVSHNVHLNVANGGNNGANAAANGINPAGNNHVVLQIDDPNEEDEDDGWVCSLS